MNELIKQFNDLKKEVEALRLGVGQVQELSKMVKALSEEVKKKNKGDGVPQELKEVKSIPLATENALRERLGTPVLQTSKLTTAENQTINEGGVSILTVLKAPDGFLLCKINGVLYYLPYYL